MKKAQLLFVTDAVAFACFIFLISSGLIIRYLLPPGSGRWASLWSMNRHQWGDVHFWLAMLFLTVIGIHLAMHWRWVVTMVGGKIRSCSKRRKCYGLAAVFVLILLAVAPILDFYW